MDLAARLTAELGAENLVTADLEDYLDMYPVGDPAEFAPSMVAKPGDLEQIRAVLRLATEAGVPVWTYSQGRNNGYGGRSPRVAGSVTLDLSRMNRVLDIDSVSGTALIEPGVRFFDLYDAVRASGAPWWPSVPDLGWGSVIGNALDRGMGYTTRGEHFENLCGLEVMLPDGDLVRTGMGALTGSKSWNIYRPGLGPAVDGLFSQSNLGVVTKANVWLMPRPARWAFVDVAADGEDDLAALVDAVRPLRFDGTIEATISVALVTGIATMLGGDRAQWIPDGGPMTDAFAQDLMSRFGFGRWNMQFALYGSEAMLAARIGDVRAALEAAVPGVRVSITEYEGDTPVDDIPPHHRTRAAIPGMYLESMADWWGGRGGHIAVSPVAPLTGADAMALERIVRPRFEEFGFDWMSSYHSRGRHMLQVALILFNRDDADQARRARELSTVVIRDLAAAGYGEYRTHLAIMDQAAAVYDFNDGALGRLHTRLKDALDPAGILSPGKQGVWPSAR